LEAQSASTNQISLKSDDFRLRYSDKTIFKMAAVRHLEFSKFGNLVM